MKYFNPLIDNKSSSEKKTRSISKLIEMLRNDDYAIGNLLDYLYD